MADDDYGSAPEDTGIENKIRAYLPILAQKYGATPSAMNIPPEMGVRMPLEGMPGMQGPATMKLPPPGSVPQQQPPPQQGWPRQQGARQPSHEMVYQALQQIVQKYRQPGGQGGGAPPQPMTPMQQGQIRQEPGYGSVQGGLDWNAPGGPSINMRGLQGPKVQQNSARDFLQPPSTPAPITGPQVDAISRQFGVSKEDAYGLLLKGNNEQFSQQNERYHSLLMGKELQDKEAEKQSARDAEKQDESFAGMTGDDLLQALPSKMKNQVTGIIEGRIPYPTGFLLKTPYGQKLAAAVTQADPTFEAGKASSRVDVRKEFTKGGANTPAGIIMAGNTAIKHLGNLSDNFEKIGNYAGIPYVPFSSSVPNYLKNKVSLSSGQGEALIAVQNASDRFNEEATKFYRGIGGTESDIQRGMINLDPMTMSPDQMRTAIATQAELMQSKIEQLQERWRTGMGPLVKDFEIVGPHSKNVMDSIMKRKPGESSKGAGGGSAPPAAIKHLRSNPKLRAAFDEKYGAGAADSVLDQR